MKHIGCLSLMLAGGILLAQAQTPTARTLPVYQVVKSGASETEAAALAKQLHIPTEALVSAHGRVSFIDPEKYLAIPKAPVSDPETIRRLRDATKNKNPATDIRLTAIDVHALSELRV